MILRLMAGLLLFIWTGCAPEVQFLQVGANSYPPKPDVYEVLVFIEGDKPQRDYEVIGMVFVEGDVDQAYIKNGKSVNFEGQGIVDLLKKEAKKHGADAIIDVRINLNRQFEIKPTFELNTKRKSNAKAIVFK